MTKLILIPVLFLFVNAFSQTGDVWKPVSREAQAYHESRLRLSVPPHGLKKVKDLIDQIEPDEKDNEALPERVFESLPVREKFTYTMLHGEYYAKDGSAVLPVEEEDKKIFAYLPNMFEDYAWSDRQLGFLQSNRDSVIRLMKESIERSRKVGLNYKHAIIVINAVEMIPFIVRMHRQIKKDFDLLTVLMLLMRENEYPVFIRSSSHRKLYSDENDLKAYLDYNRANEELIVRRALSFYQSQIKTGA